MAYSGTIKQKNSLSNGYTRGRLKNSRIIKACLPGERTVAMGAKAKGVYTSCDGEANTLRTRGHPDHGDEKKVRERSAKRENSDEAGPGQIR